MPLRWSFLFPQQAALEVARDTRAPDPRGTEEPVVCLVDIVVDLTGVERTEQRNCSETIRRPDDRFDVVERALVLTTLEDEMPLAVRRPNRPGHEVLERVSWLL